MFKKRYPGILTVCLLSVFFIVPLFAAEEKNSCNKEGIVVKNLTLHDDLWYRKNDGACMIWRRDHLFVIKPKDTMGIFSDLTCETPYCMKMPVYTDYKQADTDGNCRVRMLPDCDLSDMQ
jgi:hypothetical protein